ncbi:MAG: stage V sporulation protein AD [Clostridia bacterium]|nr:stage V sporulation protein AD [Clostridia bacterium]
MESEGPLGELFDIKDDSDKYGMDSFERAEAAMQLAAMNTAIAKSGVRETDIEALFAGDLMNQCTSSAYGLLTFDIPYFGLYGACSTAAESIMLASMATSNGIFEYAAAITSSHYCTAERQYRSPLEYGSQRPPTAQWTVTGSGAFIIGRGGKVRITGALPGIVREMGVRDANNMGAAMAPAAADTILRYYSYCGGNLDGIDLIVTGDLGAEGLDILKDIIGRDKPDIVEKLTDCGTLIYDMKRQDVHSGGSGCGCSAVVLASYLLPKLERGELRGILFIGTGAMMSPMTIQQGEGIPAIAHLVRIEAGR